MLNAICPKSPDSHVAFCLALTASRFGRISPACFDSTAERLTSVRSIKRVLVVILSLVRTGLRVQFNDDTLREAEKPCFAARSNHLTVRFRGGVRRTALRAG